MFESFTRTEIATSDARIAFATAAAGRRCCCCTATRRPTSCGTRSRRAGATTSPWSPRPARLRRQLASRRPRADHEPYSKRAMARDQVAVMAAARLRALLRRRPRSRRALRLPPGARSSRARDASWPCSTSCRPARHFRRADMAFGHGLLALVLPGPALRPAGADDRRRPRRLLPAPEHASPLHPRGARRLSPLPTRNPTTIHAMCEDYRAGATIDFALDEADRKPAPHRLPGAGALGRAGQLPEWYDVSAVWRDWADDVRGRAHRLRPLPRRGSARRDARGAGTLPGKSRLVVLPGLMKQPKTGRA